MMRNTQIGNVVRKLNLLNTRNVLAHKVQDKQRFIRSSVGSINLQCSQRFAHSGSHGHADKSQIIKYSLYGAAAFGILYAITKTLIKRPIHAATSKSQTPAEEVPVEETREQADDNAESDAVPLQAAAEEVQVEETREQAVENAESDAASSTPEVAAEEKSSEPLADESTQATPAEKEAEPVAEEKTPEAAPIKTSEEAPVTKVEAKNLPDIPSHAQYLIIGGGTSAMAAFKAIRANDPYAKVLVVTEEQYKPYMRPPLSKEMWFTNDQSLVDDLKFKLWNGTTKSLFFLEDEFFVEPKYLNEQDNGGVAVVTSRSATKIDAPSKKVILDNGWEINYDKCLIATGGRPRNLPVFDKDEKFGEKVTLFRNIEDFKKLQEIAKQGKTIAIVGGGFLGSELACALGSFNKKAGGKVIQIFPESGNLGKILPQYLSQWTTKRVQEEGVKVIPNVNLQDASVDNEKIVLKIAQNKKDANQEVPSWVVADHVVVAVGLSPNVELATASGFEVDPKFGGFLVNAELQARNSVWVAGDAACFYDTKLGRRRVEHHDHAVVSGRLAGENMTGAAKPYWHQSMFWSDLGPKIGFEAIGLIDSSLNTMGLFVDTDDASTPQAFVTENDNSLRSEVDTVKSTEVAIKGDARAPAHKDQYGRGVIFYLKNERPVGILMWNVFKQMPIARKILSEQEKINDYQEIAKLFQLSITGTDAQEQK